MFGSDPLTAVHTLISLVAIALGIPALVGLLRPGVPERWTTWFIAAAVATSATGFLFPFVGVTPAFATGVVASLVLLLVIAARYRYALVGRWRAVHAAGLVASQYLLVFVLIAQAFAKLPPLRALAPTGTEAPFAIAQVICLAAFVLIGIRAVRGAGPRLAA